jgi:hypothetical protein
VAVERSIGKPTLLVSSSRQTPLPTLGTIERRTTPQWLIWSRSGRNLDMITKIRRIALVLGSSAGIIAATAATAHAGINLGNHCEPRLAESHR